jgi:uncharacterized membrane protein YtjA (UPF0391 family)
VTKPTPEGVAQMLTALAVILLIAWLLGLVAFNVTSGVIHLLLVVAVVMFVLNLMSGRRRTV